MQLKTFIRSIILTALSVYDPESRSRAAAAAFRGSDPDCAANPDYCDTLFVIHGDKSHRIQAPFGVTVHYE